jgi:hypothetical protein
MVLAANDGVTILQIALAAGALSGVGGTIIALLKWKPDVNSAAVVQAQGTMEMMKSLADDLRDDRDYWHERCDAAEMRVQDLEGQLKETTARLEEELMQCRAMIRGMTTEEHAD